MAPRSLKADSALGPVLAGEELYVLIARSLDIMEGFLPLMENYPALFYNEIKRRSRKVR